MSTLKEAQPPAAMSPGASQEGLRFRRRLWWNWFILSGVLGITTAAFVVIVPTFDIELLSDAWPSSTTAATLFVGYTALIFCLIGYLTMQQRSLSAMSGRIVDLRQQASDSEQKQSERLYALFDVSSMMGVESELQSIFDRITAACVDTFNSDQASLMVFDPAAGKLHVRSAHGHLNIDAVLGTSQDVGKGFAGWAAKNRKALIVGGKNGMEGQVGIELRWDALISAMVVPIVARDELVGVLNVSSRSAHVDYDDQDLQAMQVFAANAGSCIRHAEQAEWMRKTIRTLETKLRETSASEGFKVRP